VADLVALAAEEMRVMLQLALEHLLAQDLMDLQTQAAAAAEGFLIAIILGDTLVDLVL
jgi:hypothetical protein